ncbi:MAG: phosphatidate cytidylyltransferase [Gammaproteobacteria bacterium]
MLKTRLLTAGFLIPLSFSLIAFTPLALFMKAVWGLVGLAAFEWAKLSGLKSQTRLVFVGRLVYAALLMAASFYSNQYQLAGLWLKSAPIFWLFMGLCVIGVNYSKNLKTFLSHPITSLLMGFWVLLPFGYALIFLREYGQRILEFNILNTTISMKGLFLVTSIALVAIADSSAYFVGKRWGKHKLAPSISPGKTWEGFLGALAAALLLSPALSMLWAQDDANKAWLSACWIIMVVLSVVGDLFESLFKRAQSLKDSGNILPGHGGILDRVDSLTAGLSVLAGIMLWI